MKFDKSYLEWCEIMNQKPDIRDQIIFSAGATFYSIENDTIEQKSQKSQKLSFNSEWLLEKLEELRVSHYNCGDSWYSCPKSSEGCVNEEVDDECNCGADKHNAVVDELIQYVNYLVELNKNE